MVPSSLVLLLRAEQTIATRFSLRPDLVTVQQGAKRMRGKHALTSQSPLY